MKVTFKKTRANAYSVLIEGPGRHSSTMDPAPGYDERLPHDAAHFIVENELGIEGGVFGQIAAGGTAGTVFTEDEKRLRRQRRRGKRIAKENKPDARFSEHAIFAIQSRWENRDYIPDTVIRPSDIERIIKGFDRFAERWSKLPVGGSLSMEWKPVVSARRKR